MSVLNNQQRETRTFAVIEFRAATEEGKAPKIVGHAANFNALSEDLGGFREMIAPGAFTNAIKTSDVRALWNHDSNIVLGRNKSGTLRLSEDDKGLAFEIDMPDTQLVRDMVGAPIARGDVSQCSFGFRTIKDHWEKLNGEVIRTLLEVELFDVSPVTYAAYHSTDVAVRSMQAAFPAAPGTSWQADLMRRRLDLAL
jgi:HK97 family phage prohead protease